MQYLLLIVLALICPIAMVYMMKKHRGDGEEK